MNSNHALPPILEFRLLGPPQISQNGVPLTNLTSAKAQALLYYLAMTGRGQTRSILASLLWSEHGDAEARGNLRKVIKHLRDHLADHLVLESELLEFQSEQGYWVDAVALATTLSAVRTADPEQLEQAITLYRGDFLEGFYVRDAPEFERWMLTERARLRELMLQGLATLAMCYASQGNLPQAIATARRLLELEPWREETHRQVMVWLMQDGQRGAALGQYELCRRDLAEELDVEPAPETLALVEQIRVNVLPTQLAPPEKQSTRTLRLPSTTTTFVGRQQELRDVPQRLANPACRLLNLIGPGGIGKTRLALAVAQAVFDVQLRTLDSEHDDQDELKSITPKVKFPDGVYWINLQPLEAVDALVPAIADAVGFPLSGPEDVTAQLLRYLHNKSLLLVLDNFEQLVDPSGVAVKLLVEIIQKAPEVKLLLTSREVINLQEEWLYPVGALAFPSATTTVESDQVEIELEAYSAVQLFVERACQYQPTFTPTAHADALTRICQLTGGIPLALELAASWSKTLPCEEIAQELAAGLTILSTSLRNVPERHRTMHAVFEQSWQRLSAQEQGVFQRLAIFRGGFRREAAQSVAGATLPVLSNLVAQSFLKQEPDGRYQIHELLRQYGAKRLAESPTDMFQVHERHCAYYADFLYRESQPIAAGDQMGALARCTSELDNIRAAWQWAVEHNEVDAIRQSAASLYWICQLQSRYLEGTNALANAAQRLAQEPETELVIAALVEVLPYLAWMAMRLGQLEQATAAATQGLALQRKYNILPLPSKGNGPLCILSVIAAIRGDYAQAEKLAHEEYQVIKATKQFGNLPVARFALANAALAQGKIEAAHQAAAEAVSLSRKAHQHWFLAYCLNTLGDISLAQDDLTAARRHYQAAYEIRKEFNDPEGMALALNHLGEVALRQVEPAQAATHFQASLALYAEINDLGGLATSHKGLGQVAFRQRDFEQARQQYRQALTIAANISYTPLIISLLICASELLVETGACEIAWLTLAFVLQTTKSDHTAKAEAHHLLDQCAGDFTPAQRQDLLDQGRMLTLDEVISQVQHAFELATL